VGRGKVRRENSLTRSTRLPPGATRGKKEKKEKKNVTPPNLKNRGRKGGQLLERKRGEEKKGDLPLLYRADAGARHRGGAGRRFQHQEKKDLELIKEFDFWKRTRKTPTSSISIGGRKGESERGKKGGEASRHYSGRASQPSRELLSKDRVKGRSSVHVDRGGKRVNVGGKRGEEGKGRALRESSTMLRQKIKRSG